MRIRTKNMMKVNGGKDENSNRISRLIVGQDEVRKILKECFEVLYNTVT